MKVFKIAWMLFKNNFNLYKFYLAVLIFTIGIYYNFLSINFNPSFRELNEQYTYARTASVLCSIILFFAVLFFMIHANNFFYKLRYKEIGTYMLMGIQGSKIGLVFAIESIFLGGIAFLIGLPLGILFSKLFFMLMGKAMILNTRIPFYVPLRAVQALLLIFAGIIILLGLKNYWMVRKSKLIQILHAAKKEESLPKMKWIRGVFGVLCITGGYILSLNILEWNMKFFSTSIAILVIICVGTYFFFGSFLAILLRGGIQNKKFIYKGSRLISFSNTLFRMGTHYRSFAMTAILSASTVAAFSGSLALKYYADTNTLVEAPYSISYINQDQNINGKIKQMIQNSSHSIITENQSHFIKSQISYFNSYAEVVKECLVTSYSEVKKSLKVTHPKDYETILQEIQIHDNEMISILHSGLLFSGINNVHGGYMIKGNQYVLKKEVKIPFIGKLPSVGQYETYIVTDAQYSQLKKNEEELTLQGITFSDPEHSKDLVMKIASIMNNPNRNLNSFVGQYVYKYYLIGSLYFLGLVMAVVFMVATFSTIYFKILSDAIMDREQYKMLIKIGMSKEEITKSIHTQVGIAFVLPAFMGIMHSVMAIQALGAFMHYRFLESILIGVGVFIAVMSLFYIYMSRKYRELIWDGVRIS